MKKIKILKDDKVLEATTYCELVVKYYEYTKEKNKGDEIIANNPEAIIQTQDIVPDNILTQEEINCLTILFALELDKKITILTK
jgi:hypothetical protein